eukprot:GHUV01030932.1.p5 GENE.GHUV01030932.1~~GHUV01030932.1.p5  ORF type:complete len:104 (-),score=24.73 GHUV01030932.1:156-467(-)
MLLCKLCALYRFRVGSEALQQQLRVVLWCKSAPTRNCPMTQSSAPANCCLMIADYASYNSSGEEEDRSALPRWLGPYRPRHCLLPGVPWGSLSNTGSGDGAAA